MMKPGCVRLVCALAAWSVLLLTVGGCVDIPLAQSGGGSTDEPVSSFTFDLSVARHQDQPFSSFSVDGVLDTASRILQRIDTECPDLATPVTFQRFGDVTALDLGSSVVTSEAQLDALFAEPYDIKIVTAMIGVCGIPSTNDMTTILGCAYSNGSVVIVATADPDVWAHEWGHVQGLPHRDNCPRNIMHSYELMTNAVNAVERNAFLTPTPQARVSFNSNDSGSAAPDAALLRPQRCESMNDWLDSWSGGTYLAGLPSAVVPLEFSGEQVDTLLANMATCQSLHERANLIRAIGLAGDAHACQPLIEQLDRVTGQQTVDQLQCAAETLLAMGRLASQDKSDLAINSLLAATDPSYWTQRSCRLSVGDGQQTDLQNDLARLAVMALGVSDTSTAQTFLAALRDRVDGSRDAWMGSQIDEALSRLAGDESDMRTPVRAIRMP